jgi:hypothetical protein
MDGGTFIFQGKTRYLKKKAPKKSSQIMFAEVPLDEISTIFHVCWPSFSLNRSLTEVILLL